LAVGRWLRAVTGLRPSAEGNADAAVQLDHGAAWRLFTKDLSPTEARAHAILAGDPALAAKVLDTVSILA
jgi:ATP/maltotriose-dependent transcriptional regulator MalT